MEAENGNADSHVRKFFQRQMDSHRRCGAMSCATGVLAAALALSTMIAVGGQAFSPQPDASEKKEKIVKEVVREEIGEHLKGQEDRLVGIFVDALRKGQVTGDIFQLDMLDAGLLSIDVKKVRERISEDGDANGFTMMVLNLLVAAVSGSLAYSQGRDGIEAIRKLKATQRRLETFDLG